MTFGARFVTSINVVATVLVARSMTGSLLTQAFILFVIFGSLNVAFSGAYLALKGMARRERLSRSVRRERDRLDKAASRRAYKLSRIQSWKLRRALGLPFWFSAQVWLEERLKYPLRIYLPWGGGQHHRYITFVVTGFFSSVASWYLQLELVSRHMPVSIATFLGWASSCWLSLWWARRLLRDFKWVDVAIPVIGLVQLAGVAIAAGLVSGKGVDLSLLGNLVVLSLLATSVFGAWSQSFVKNTRVKEEEFLHANAMHLLPEDQVLIATKLAFWPSLMRTVWSVAAFFASQGLAGPIHVKDWSLMLAGVGFFAVSSLGSRVSLIALAEGEPALNGIGATAGLGFTFFWVWVCQGIGTTWFQLAGAAIALAGAFAWAFTVKTVRTQVKSAWHQWISRRRA